MLFLSLRLRSQALFPGPLWSFQDSSPSHPSRGRLIPVCFALARRQSPLLEIPIRGRQTTPSQSRPTETKMACPQAISYSTSPHCACQFHFERALPRNTSDLSPIRERLVCPFSGRLNVSVHQGPELRPVIGLPSFPGSCDRRPNRVQSRFWVGTEARSEERELPAPPQEIGLRAGRSVVVG